MKNNISTYYYEMVSLLGKDTKKIPFVVGLFFIISLFELIGIGLIGPYIAVVMDPELVKDIPDWLLYFLSFSSYKSSIINNLGILLIIVFLIKTILSILINKKLIHFSQMQQVRLRSELMHAYQSLSLVESQKRNSSECIYTIGHLAGVFANTVLMLLRFVGEVVVSLSILVFLAWKDIDSLVMLLGLIGSILLFYYLKFNKVIKYYGKMSNKASISLLQSVHEGLVGLKDIRILGKENFFHDRVARNAKDVASNYVSGQFLLGIPRYLLEFSVILFIVLLVLINLNFERNTTELMTTLGVFGIAALRLLPSSSSIMNSILEIKNGRDSIMRLSRDLRSAREHSNYKSRIDKKINNYQSNFLSIEMKGVNFKYLSSQSSSLENISIRINKNEVIGIMGKSGSGKSTLVDMLLGLLPPDSGSIEYNEEPLSKNKMDWMGSTAYLPQQTFIIDDSIKNNIALGVEESKISDIEIDNAIKKAKLYDFIKNLEKGVDTIIGENGVRMSGGQRQRISLARAFYSNRDVLVMDESTSALDSETEREVLNEIKQYKGSLTMIIIAHRLSTLGDCDRIYELDNGRIINCFNK
jgi:ATP-binding cassette, subfamily B, bacterial PglK